MQKIVLFLSILFLSASTLSAQKADIVQKDALMSLGSRPAFFLKFKDINSKDVESLWKSFAKDNFGKKTKRNRKTKEYTTIGAEAPSINGSEFDVYANIDGTKKEAMITVWFDLGTNFLNATDNGAGTEEAIGYLQAFNNEVEKKKAADHVKEEKKMLEDLEGDLKKLKKKNDDLHKDIDNYKEKIRKAEQAIKENEANQEKKRSEIDDQEKNLNDAQKHLDGIGG